MDDIPYVALAPAEVRVTGGCVFDGCPAGHPFVYYMTSYRNRGASYNRWVRSVLEDVRSPVNKVPAQCLCLAVADFNDVVSGVPIGLALEDWPYAKAVISLHGPFSRAGGFQRCIDHLVTTPKDQSLMFFVDADMIAYPGLLNRILQYTVQGVVSHLVLVPSAVCFLSIFFLKDVVTLPSPPLPSPPLALPGTACAVRVRPGCVVHHKE